MRDKERQRENSKNHHYKTAYKFTNNKKRVNLFKKAHSKTMQNWSSVERTFALCAFLIKQWICLALGSERDLVIRFRRQACSPLPCEPYYTDYFINAGKIVISERKKVQAEYYEFCCLLNFQIVWWTCYSPTTLILQLSSGPHHEGSSKEREVY